MSTIPNSPPSRPPTKLCSLKTPNFSQIPSKFSLNPTTSSSLQHQHQGHIENLHLISLCKQNKTHQALDFITQMDQSNIPVHLHSYESLLKSCAKLRDLSTGKLLHNHMHRSHKCPPVFILNRVLQTWCECGSLEDARQLFDEMPERNLGSWGVIISAYAKAGDVDKAVELFSGMESVEPDVSIVVSVLWLSGLELGKQLHSFAIKKGFAKDAKMGTAILNMYAKCGCLEDAKLVFDQLTEKNEITWTSLMVSYMNIDNSLQVLDLLLEMIILGVKLDEYVFSIILKACSSLRNETTGQQIQGYVLKLGMADNVAVGTALVDLYVKCENIESASRAFDCIAEPNAYSWSALITGYSQAGEFNKCLKLFKYLKRIDAELNPNIYTSIFQACSSVTDFILGSQTHADAIKRGLVSYLYGDSAMITMYAKCGMLNEARQVFESVKKPSDNVIWTAIIAGYAYHGNAHEALKLFTRMVSYKVKPNAITFVAVLTAFNYCGLVKEAKQCVDSMSSKYGVEPSIHHYNCMIDAYARSGMLNESFSLINNMPFEPNVMSWKCLLGGCVVHKNFELGKIAAEYVMLLDLDDTSTYVLMFNLHASSNQWEDAGLIRKMMVKRRLKKEVSCSWIYVNGKVHSFVVGDKHHLQANEIYAKLKEFEWLNNNNDEEDEGDDDVMLKRKGQVLDHSERLAIVYGLIATGEGSRITVFKNLRACNDCHEFAKRVSLATRREIVVRDANRFHHFKSGVCSCGDYW
ncbi:pentatricopeptide repeat-containing protein At5g13270, chloroplastic-like [Bidens hawaiensis]|uniref:pentatricopeptide repeat-containing protein At5g13270, chloroplastic-like n=1 Tax=Bidens hawaiensis TaxID=980011 RepID=UPI0040498A07